MYKIKLKGKVYEIDEKSDKPMMQQLVEQGDRHGGTGPDAAQRLDCLAADSFILVGDESDQGLGGRLGRRADSAQGVGGVGPDRGRIVSQLPDQGRDRPLDLCAMLPQGVDCRQSGRLVARSQRLQ